ncbi:MAG: hypothetical protein HYY13_00635 [Nitrospirae bacterium]|nr:hypothetical protein [Nitrospirota bacterium]
MTTLAKETAQIVDRLPPEKARALLDYARFLAEKVAEEKWQRAFRDQKYAHKLRAMADKALDDHRRGKTRPIVNRNF